MQAPAHFLTGALIQGALQTRVPARRARLATALLAPLSHGVLDRLARLTYHPADALPGDWFWVGYHALVGLVSLAVLRRHWREYKVGLVFSVLPDLDWLLMPLGEWLLPQAGFWREPLLHNLLAEALNRVPPFQVLDLLPDRTQARVGVLVEAGLLAALVLTMRRFRPIRDRPREPPV